MSRAKQEYVIDVGEAEFESRVIEQSRERPVIVDFWAAWCQPCRLLGPILERLVSERAGEVILAKVDIDGAPQAAAAYHVSTIPMVLAFRDGKPVLEFVGLLPEDEVRRFLDRVCPSEADRLVRQAQEQENAKPEDAEADYRRALEMDRNHQGALLGLARILLQRHEDHEAAVLLEHVNPGGDHAEDADRLRGILTLRQSARDLGDETTARQRLNADPGDPRAHYEMGAILAAAWRYPEALELLLGAAEKDRQLARDKVREMMVTIFRIIGIRSPRADEYRDKLARVLY